MALSGYLLFIGWLTLRPLTVPWVDAASVELFATIERELARGPRAALHSLGGELLLLAPLGALLPLASGRCGSRLGSFVRTALTTALLAIGLEALRSAVPGQMVNVDTVLLNVVGAAAAHLLLYPTVRLLLRRRFATPAAGGGDAPGGGESAAPGGVRVPPPGPASPIGPPAPGRPPALATGGPAAPAPGHACPAPGAGTVAPVRTLRGRTRRPYGVDVAPRADASGSRSPYV